MAEKKRNAHGLRLFALFATQVNRIGTILQRQVQKRHGTGGVTMPIDEYMKAACWIVCPMCDEPKCVGRFNCPEIKAWIEKKRREYDAGKV